MVTPLSFPQRNDTPPQTGVAPAQPSELGEPPTVIVTKRPSHERKQLKRQLPELLWMEKLARRWPQFVRAHCEAELEVDSLTLPLWSLALGRSDGPALLITAGVHGIERIGSQLLLAWLHALLERMQWDTQWRARIEKSRLLLVPIVNPAGMYLNQRGNRDGIDLNRHAPIDCQDPPPWPLAGQRLSRHLPWYRGRGQPEAVEFTTLRSFVQRQLAQDPFCLALDIHSGFGWQDHLWFPYAFRREPIERVADYVALKNLWERAHPHHDYLFEPQSNHYRTHGDIWDFLYREAQEANHTLLPLTLEVGSWRWLKKRPQQLFNITGLFNPLVPHRHARVLRRHMVLLDFLLASATNHTQWQPDDERIPQLQKEARQLWYHTDLH